RSGYADRLPVMTATPPTDQARGASGTRARAGVIGVTVVCLLAGLLFGTSASLAQDRSLSGGATDLVGLITSRDDQVRELSDEAERLRADVATLQERVDTSETRRIARRADQVAPEIGLAPVTGTAVQVTLDDAGYT